MWAAVNDVCDFVEGLGLGQYRKKFMHHVVHGSLLLRLDDDLLRKELAIGPLVSCLCTPAAADIDTLLMQPPSSCVRALPAGVLLPSCAQALAIGGGDETVTLCVWRPNQTHACCRATGY